MTETASDMELSQINLFVDDFPAMLAFYRDTLGLGIRNIDPGPPCVPLVNWVQLQSGAAAIELFDAAVHWDRSLLENSNRQACQLCFVVADAASERDRLVAAGVKVDPLVSERWGRYASFRDPEGNWLQIFEVFGHGS